MKNKYTRRRKGISLIEIIVATTILSVLALLTVAGYRNVMGRVHATVCQQNLREIHKGLAMAQVDNQGMVMPDLPTPGYWFAPIDGYMGGVGTSINRLSVSSSAWICPTDDGRLRDQYHDRGYGEGQYSGYPMNTHLTVSETVVNPVTGEEGKRVKGLPVAGINNPANKIYVIESVHNTSGLRGPYTLMTYTPYGFKAYMRQVHPGGNNVLFVDGRVESIPPEHPLCSLEVNTARPWWNPNY